MIAGGGCPPERRRRGGGPAPPPNELRLASHPSLISSEHSVRLNRSCGLMTSETRSSERTSTNGRARLIRSQRSQQAMLAGVAATPSRRRLRLPAGILEGNFKTDTARAQLHLTQRNREIADLRLQATVARPSPDAARLSKQHAVKRFCRRRLPARAPKARRRACPASERATVGKPSASSVQPPSFAHECAGEGCRACGVSRRPIPCRCSAHGVPAGTEPDAERKKYGSQKSHCASRRRCPS
jgi:hypothetical protein